LAGHLVFIGLLVSVSTGSYRLSTALRPLRVRPAKRLRTGYEPRLSDVVR
jgi:hypothetical protein